MTDIYPRFKIIGLLILIIVLLVCALRINVVRADEDNGLESVLEGFEDKETSGDALKDVIQGSEDKPEQAEQSDDMSESTILQGFEDEQKTGDELQDVMEGLGEESKPGRIPDEMSDEDIMEGFADEGREKPDTVADDRFLPSFLSIDGYLKLSSVYAYRSHFASGTGTDWHGLTRLRPEIKLELDFDFSETWQARAAGRAFHDFAYTIDGRGNYTDDVLDNYENEIELDELYLQGSITEDLDIKAGRQIVVWGRSDNIRITDVLNPLDVRWLGLVDIEKLRLPITMTKIDYYIKGWSLTGLIAHEVRYNKNPEFGSDFFPESRPLPSHESPAEGFSMNTTQYAASLNGIFQGWDVSFYFADIYSQNGHLVARTLAPVPQFKIEHARIQMFGGAFNIAWGNWLFKTEAAVFDGLRFSNTPGKEFYRLDALAGFEYSGLSDATVTLEIANRHYFDFDERMKNSPDFQKEDMFEWAVRITKPYLNDTLNLSLVAGFFGFTADDGGFQRLSAEYDLTDSIELRGGLVFYQSGDLLRTKGNGENDRVFFEVQYNF